MNEETRWQDTYEDQEISESPTLANFKSPEEALKGYMALNAWKGGAVSLPGEEATPADIAKFIAKTRERVPNIAVMPDDDNPDDVKRFWGDLGVPEDVDGYAPTADAGVLPEEMDAQLKEIASKSGLTTKQYLAMRDQYVEANTSITEQNATDLAEHEAQLKQTWGGAYDENIAITDAMVTQFQDKNAELGPLNNAARLFMMNVAKSLGSDPQIFNQINSPKPAKTPADIRVDQDKYRAQLTNRDKPLNGQRRKDVLSKYNQTFVDLEPYD